MNIHNIYIIKYLFLLICSELHRIGNNSIIKYKRKLYVCIFQTKVNQTLFL